MPKTKRHPCRNSHSPMRSPRRANAIWRAVRRPFWTLRVCITRTEATISVANSLHRTQPTPEAVENRVADKEPELSLPCSFRPFGHRPIWAKWSGKELSKETTPLSQLRIMGGRQWFAATALLLLLARSPIAARGANGRLNKLDAASSFTSNGPFDTIAAGNGSTNDGSYHAQTSTVFRPVACFECNTLFGRLCSKISTNPSRKSSSSKEPTSCSRREVPVGVRRVCTTDA